MPQQDLRNSETYLHMVNLFDTREAFFYCIDACPTGDQEVTSSIPAGYGNILK